MATTSTSPGRHCSTATWIISRFAPRGGKLVHWHGWSDQRITPQSTLEYDAAMRAVDGKPACDRHRPIPIPRISRG